MIDDTDQVLRSDFEEHQKRMKPGQRVKICSVNVCSTSSPPQLQSLTLGDMICYDLRFL